MDSSIELLKQLYDQVSNLQYKDGNKDALDRRAKMYISKIFGDMSDYLDDIKAIRWSPYIITSSTTKRNYEEAFNKGKKQMLNLINTMQEDILFDIVKAAKKGDNTNNETDIKNDNIFLVHGHNETMKQAVARSIEQIGLKPVILHEQPSQGKTIIEKITHFSNVGFAIVLLSADDIAYPKDGDGSKAMFRARQNVILELGYFLGKLGRDRVLALHEENVKLEIPTDYQGVLFVPFDASGSWKYNIIKELKASGYDIDANKII